ncbi:MAG: pyridoxamine 5'-phosphate oxidase family protein [Dehalococcoidia bacterium]|nr:pyridoxamine 5'-phosphate oxidase family protein [Dehalococcoidia bacterium]
MPIKFTDEMKTLVNSALADGMVNTLATASKDGWPSIGFRGSMIVWDDTHLAWWERSVRDGLHHIKENPKALVLYRNTKPDMRRNWRFFGHVTGIYESGPIREEVMKRVVQRELDADPERKGIAVIMEVDVVMGGPGQVVMQREGVHIPGVL